VEGLVREQGEGEGFFGFLGNAKSEEDRTSTLEERGKLSENQRIVSAAPETMSWWIFVLGGTNGGVRLHRECGEDRRGADKIVGLARWRWPKARTFFM